MSSDHPDQTLPVDDHLMLSSRVSVVGKPIDPHRSLARLAFPKRRLLHVLLVPTVFNLLVLLLLDTLTGAWYQFFQFWITQINLPAVLGHALIGPEGFRVSLPTLTLPANLPDSGLWWLIAGLTLISWVAARLIPQPLLPLRYLLRLAVLIQTSALIFFALFPGRFPYQISDHLYSLQGAGIGMMLVMPWVHGLIYHVFGFSLGQKLALSGLTLLYLSLALPCLIMLHSYLLLNCSLMIMPLLNFLGGIMLLLMGCIGLYGWAMSWTQNRKQY